MKSAPFFPKVDPINFKKFEDTPINNEIDQNYNKIVELLEVFRPFILKKVNINVFRESIKK